MKKISLLFAVFGLISTAAIAQDGSRKTKTPEVKVTEKTQLVEKAQPVEKASRVEKTAASPVTEKKTATASTARVIKLQPVNIERQPKMAVREKAVNADKVATEKK